VLFSEKDQQKENSQTQLSTIEQRVKIMQEQLRGKDYELEISQRLREQQLTNFHEQQRHLHEQMREKDQQEENTQRQLREMEQQLREKDEQKENLQRQLREMEQQLREKDEEEKVLQRRLRMAHEQMREKDQQEENTQRQLREMEQQLREKDKQEENLERQLREMELQLREKDEQEENLQRQLREMEQQLRNLQDQHREKEDETANLHEQVNELEVTLSTAQQALSDRQRGQVTPDWVISRDQIQLTDKLLGMGPWGSVVEGKYCGCSVAVKQIHELILSPHNRSLFEREMAIASVCRHPCLLQFVGATNEEGSPLFVTELMESSLRALLEQRPLAGTEVSIISLDVAQALNYLHQKKPSPIIHRDISSTNVLLWRQGDKWRGKVSDYGSANFMQHTMTACPGAVIYMAPEAVTPNQTVKIDVYSFGVLVCEMCIRELPDPERRNQQIAMVTNRRFRTLIRRCLQSDPKARPNIEEIIEELEGSLMT